MATHSGSRDPGLAPKFPLQYLFGFDEHPHPASKDEKAMEGILLRLGIVLS
jgi:hypothetical protein